MNVKLNFIEVLQIKCFTLVHSHLLALTNKMPRYERRVVHMDLRTGGGGGDGGDLGLARDSRQMMEVVH